MGRRNPTPISGMVLEVAPADAACVPNTWVGLTVGTSHTLGSTIARPAGRSATKGLLAIPFAPSRRLRNVLLRFCSALPAILFSSCR